MRALDSELPLPPQRRRRLAARRDEPVICLACGRRIERTARNQAFCSPECRRGFVGYRHPKAPKRIAVWPSKTFRPKGGSKNLNVFERLRAPILGPRQVLEIELIDGRTWAPVTSSDGVTGFVAKLAKSALIKGRGP